MTTATKWIGTLALAACVATGAAAQGTASAPPAATVQRAPAATASLAFDTVSIKEAPAGSRPDGMDFLMEGEKAVPPKGLIHFTMPVLAYIAIAYHIREMSDVMGMASKLPDWTKNRMYTINARPPMPDITMDQLREMMRTMLVERFALKEHDDTKEGTVNRLVMIRPGVLGPDIKAHPAGETCVKQGMADMGKAPDPSKPKVLGCGVTFYMLPGQMLHIGMVDAKIEEIGKFLGGMGGFVGGLASRPTVDATGLTGTYDFTLDFHAEVGGPGGAGGPGGTNPDDTGGGPTLSGALEKQLGMRIEKGNGTIRTTVIDHISEPTPD